MDPMTTSALVSAGGNLLGGLIGGSGPSPRKLMAQQHYYDKRMAQNQMQWRASDVSKASKNYGFHPLALLGQQPMQSSVQAVGGGGRDMGSTMANLGQDISRAYAAYATREDRAVAQKAAALSLENQELQNDLLRQKIVASSAPGTGPGVAASPSVIDLPLERIGATHVGSTEPGTVTDVGYTRTRRGGYAPVKSIDATDRLEDDFLGNVGWNIRNRFLPSLGMNYSPPFKAPPGKRWYFNQTYGDYVLVNTRKGGR